MKAPSPLAGKPRHKRDTAGIDDRGISTIDPQKCSFLDVRRACHRWLMERDISYRKMHEAWSEGRHTADSTFARF